MRSLRLCAAVGCLCLVLEIGAPATWAEKDGRVRIDAVHYCLQALREPVDQPKEIPTAWTTAYACLRKVGPDDRAVLPELLDALNDSSPRIRAAAAEVIGQIGPEAKAAVPILRDFLPAPSDKPNDKEQEAQEDVVAAITALGQIGDDAIDAADDLVASLRDPIESQAQEALSRMGRPAASALLRGLKHKRAQIREGCVSLLNQLDCQNELDPAPIIELLGDQAQFEGSSITTNCVGRSAAVALPKFGSRVVRPLRESMKSRNPIVAARASHVLVRLKVFDETVANRLVDGLRNKDMQEETIGALQESELGSNPLMRTRLRSLLKDPEPRCRWIAADTLVEWGAVDLELLKVQVTRLSQPEADSIVSLLLNSKELKRLEPELARVAIKDDSQSARWLAAGLLARVAPNHPAVAANLADLQKLNRPADFDAQHFAVEAACLIGERATPKVFEIVRRGTVYGVIDDKAGQASLQKSLVAELQRAAQDPRGNWGYISNLIVLASSGCSGELLLPCLPTLIEHLAGRARGFEMGPNAASTCIGFCGKAAVPALLRALSDPKKAALRVPLIDCLGRIGPRARDALPALASLDLLKQVDGAWNVAAAIKEIGPTIECLPVLIESLEQSDGSNYAAVGAIVALGERVRPDVLKWLESRSPSRRKVAAQLLSAMPPKPEATVRPVIEILNRSSGDDLRLLQILATLGPAANEATPAVAARLKSPYVRLRTAACVTLARISRKGEHGPQTIVGPLGAAATDRFAEVRAAAADALGLIGPTDTACRASIRSLQRDSFLTVRNAADRTIRAWNDHKAPPAKTWTLYFDSDGPATGRLVAAGE